MKKNTTSIPYLKILKNAFVLTWKNRYLWWFGFFLALSNLGSFNYTNDNRDKKDFHQIFTTHPEAAKFVAIGAIIFLLIFIAIVILGIISRGALISSIGKNRAGRPSNFKSAWRTGRKFFWRVFLIDLLCGIFILGAMLVLFPPVYFLFSAHSYIIGVLMAIVAAIIFIPLIILVAYLRIFGYLYAILGKLKPWASIENAYSLFRKNIGSSFLMAICLIPVGIILFLLIAFLIIPLAIVLAPLALIFFLIAGHIGAIIVGAFGLLILGVFLIFLKSVMEVFTQAVWVLFFHEIASPKEPEAVPEEEKEESSKPVVNPVPDPTLNSERK